ncbi:hypothetical protein CKAH01_18834 [Colletotrichum kahawae]|uniref:Uncharacterized protein n=1 Tax=Colletotrichum kahawae TaxID=34407 RepID=A0AAE0D1G4_COLKA|nr:hypothetical protein CKAH01_18834 [Colletotrichum kahawae]
MCLSSEMCTSINKDAFCLAILPARFSSQPWKTYVCMHTNASTIRGNKLYGSCPPCNRDDVTSSCLGAIANQELPCWGKRLPGLGLLYCVPFQFCVGSKRNHRLEEQRTSIPSI